MSCRDSGSSEAHASDYCAATLNHIVNQVFMNRIVDVANVAERRYVCEMPVCASVCPTVARSTNNTTAIIAGSVVGGTVLLLLVLSLFIWRCTAFGRRCCRCCSSRTAVLTLQAAAHEVAPQAPSRAPSRQPAPAHSMSGDRRPAALHVDEVAFVNVADVASSHNEEAAAQRAQVQ